MIISLSFPYNNLKADEESTYYNHIMWEVTRRNQLGITHIREVYDDVCDYPNYELGQLSDGKFYCKLTGEGEPVNENKIGYGGVYLKIDLHYTNDLRC